MNIQFDFLWYMHLNRLHSEDAGSIFAKKGVKKQVWKKKRHRKK